MTTIVVLSTQELPSKQTGRCSYGQVSVAAAVTAVDIAPRIVVELEDAWAVMVTMPECMHCAMPFGLMVATFMSELAHPPEKGAMKVTGAGEGGWLKVPVAVNCTCPFMKFPPFAVAGATVIAMSMRLEFIISGCMALQPAIVNSTASRHAWKK